MNETTWDDLQLFLHVATAGGLSGAAQRTGISAPTVGRRMLALERSLGRTLFERSQQGYRLAHDGEALMTHALAMQKAADGILAWRGDAFALPIVTLASDAWLAGYMADHVDRIRSTTDTFRLCCRSAHSGVDLAFRGIDVTLLSGQPRGGNLATRRSVTMRYAVYAARAAGDAALARWISLATETAQTPADRWVFENHEAQIFTWTTAPDLLLRLIRQGAGRGLLPVFIGDADPALERLGDPVATLDHPLFIVCHDDERHRPEVRLVLDRLAGLLRSDEHRFSGLAAPLRTGAGMAGEGVRERALQETR